jgi:hypothetical protein
VLFSPVFAYPKPRSATHQSGNSPSARSPFLPSLHSSLFFSEDSALFSATAVSQPFAYQSFPHSFHHHGGCTPLAASRILPPFPKLSLFFSHSSALFCIYLHFFALTQNSTRFVSNDSALFRKNTGGMGGALLPSRAPSFSEWGCRSISSHVVDRVSDTVDSVRSRGASLTLPRVTGHRSLVTLLFPKRASAACATWYGISIARAGGSEQSRGKTLAPAPGRQQPISARGRQTSWGR